MDIFGGLCSLFILLGYLYTNHLSILFKRGLVLLHVFSLCVIAWRIVSSETHTFLFLVIGASVLGHLLFRFISLLTDSRRLTKDLPGLIFSKNGIKWRDDFSTSEYKELLRSDIVQFERVNDDTAVFKTISGKTAMVPFGTFPKEKRKIIKEIIKTNWGK